MGEPTRNEAAIRDVPASCSCEWNWRNARWVRTWPDPGCGWHTRFSGVAPTGQGRQA